MANVSRESAFLLPYPGRITRAYNGQKGQSGLFSGEFHTHRVPNIYNALNKCTHNMDLENFSDYT